MCRNIDDTQRHRTAVGDSRDHENEHGHDDDSRRATQSAEAFLHSMGRQTPTYHARSCQYLTPSYVTHALENTQPPPGAILRTRPLHRSSQMLAAG